MRVCLRDGTAVRIRPIAPSDEPMVAAFHAALSPRSVYQRYFHQVSVEQRVSRPGPAAGATDLLGGAAIVAERTDGPGHPEILALGWIMRGEPEGSAEVALVVADRWHRAGLGTALMDALVGVARRLGVRRVYGEMLADNDAMRELARRSGFVIRLVPGDARVLRAERGIA